jgi:hypothetical protein
MGIRVSAGFALAALALAGCGSSGGDSGAEGSSPVTVAAM